MISLPHDWNSHAQRIRTPIREYADVFSSIIDWKEYIIKNIQERDVKILQFLSPLDFVLQPSGIHTEWEVIYGIFPRYEKTLLEEREYEPYRKAIVSLAHLHDFVSHHPFTWFETWFDYNLQVSSLRSLFEEHAFHISDALWEVLTAEVFSDNMVGWIHGDFLPFNILLDHDTPLFIDFSNSRRDFYERDIWRFLSDRNTFKKTVWYSEWRYYPLSLYHELQDIYCETRQRYTANYDIARGKRRIILGEIWNHLDVIEVSLSRGSKNEWFRMNERAIHALLDVYT